MGTICSYANFTKRQRFGLDAIGGSGKRGAFGYTLASRALHLMLDGLPGRRDASGLGRGCWAGDSIAIVGDDQPVCEYERFEAEFTDIEANAILTVFKCDGFEQIGQAAQEDTSLFMELCHLVVTRQVLPLEPHMKQIFGPQYLRRYKELCQERPWFRPKDFATAPAEN